MITLSIQNLPKMSNSFTSQIVSVFCFETPCMNCILYVYEFLYIVYLLIFPQDLLSQHTSADSSSGGVEYGGVVVGGGHHGGGGGGQGGWSDGGVVVWWLYLINVCYFHCVGGCCVTTSLHPDWWWEATIYFDKN